MQNINNYLEVLCLTYLPFVTKLNLKNHLKRTNSRIESERTLHDWWKKLFNVK